MNENTCITHKNTGGGREPSVELFRIITMLCIVAHHYVVNSGILNEITQENAVSFHALFAQLFGWGGKTGINCFVLITGYFMCKSSIKVKKYLKLLLKIEFYKIAIYGIFLATGYESFSIKSFIRAIVPIYYLGTGFTASYLVFYLFIPYLNKLIHAMQEKEHRVLVLLCCLVGSVLQTFFKIPSAFTYVGWFMVLYFIAAYIRIYPLEIFNRQKLWGFATLAMLLLSWASVVVLSFVYSKTGKVQCYYFVSDCNKIMALLTAVCAFLFFKNLKMKKSSTINTVAASAFGVFLIHANSDSMRKWLWVDVFKNVSAFHTQYFIVHAVLTVAIVYGVCTLIDMVQIKLIEKPLLTLYDKWYSKKYNCL